MSAPGTHRPGSWLGFPHQADSSRPARAKAPVSQGHVLSTSGMPAVHLRWPRHGERSCPGMWRALGACPSTTCAPGTVGVGSTPVSVRTPFPLQVADSEKELGGECCRTMMSEVTPERPGEAPVYLCVLRDPVTEDVQDPVGGRSPDDELLVARPLGVVKPLGEEKRTCCRQPQGPKRGQGLWGIC